MEAVSDFIQAAEMFAADRRNIDLKRDVADAAGRAHQAAETANFYQRYTAPPMVGGSSFTYDPISNWDALIDPTADALAEAIDAAYQIRGILQAKAQDAERAERSWVGRVAGVVGFPSRVRQLLADRGKSAALQRAGFWASVAAQLVVGIAATVIAALIVNALILE